MDDDICRKILYLWTAVTVFVFTCIIALLNRSWSWSWSWSCELCLVRITVWTSKAYQHVLFFTASTRTHGQSPSISFVCLSTAERAAVFNGVLVNVTAGRPVTFRSREAADRLLTATYSCTRPDLTIATRLSSAANCLSFVAYSRYRTPQLGWYWTFPIPQHQHHVRSRTCLLVQASTCRHDGWDDSKDKARNTWQSIVTFSMTLNDLQSYFCYCKRFMLLQYFLHLRSTWLLPPMRFAVGKFPAITRPENWKPEAENQKAYFIVPENDNGRPSRARHCPRLR